ncbi:MAG: adenosylcobalamin-dependent ribonucleoside-diphosphate reductase [Candidatus Omnitrophica bacterium]|nr:adenosylcobalamin-dependent ribonucleoside-diphosphate reductase [Candidatus Omnitrophota bacterium]
MNNPDSNLHLTDNSKRVLERRYLKRDDRGNLLEKPEDMFHRVAAFMASGEKVLETGQSVDEWTDTYFEMMSRLEFLPNSPTLMNAGRELGQLAACFVLPVEDNLEGIFESVKHAALIHKSGGGTGFSFFFFLSKETVVQSTMGVSSGPISFLSVFDTSTDTIKQGGTRRGANMGILRVDHPDILEFIECKESGDNLNNFNISVAMTETFFKAVEEGGDYDLISPHNGQPVASLSAREVFWRIVKGAWKNGDPGVIFLDRMNADNPTPEVGEYESTNPCGEQPLLPFESCNLGSLNLSKFVNRNTGEVEWDRLKVRVHQAVRFLDNVIALNNYPLGQIQEITERNRKIGLGIMGFADYLILRGIPYGTPESYEEASRLMRFIQEESKKASADLAVERGPFANFEKSIWPGRGYPPLRKPTTTTIAPTGTISIIAGCSSGIEPLFGICYWRNVMDNDRLVEVHPIFKARALEEGFYSEPLMKRVASGTPLEEIEEIPEEIAKIFVCTRDLSPEQHVRMQAAFQKHTDNAVSKTINFHHEAQLPDVADAYLLAYRLGCKGITIYRDGSRAFQVLNHGLDETLPAESKWASLPVYGGCDLSRLWSGEPEKEPVA